jgi:two-component system, OmpR family, sensor histidine kinase PhoQ
MTVQSLRQRVLATLAVALAVFFGATVAVLEWNFAANLSRARDEVLEAQLMALVAAAEPVEATHALGLPEPPDGRMLSPDSGLHAEILDPRGRAVWRSPSALGLDFDPPPAARTGVRDAWVQRVPDRPGLALSSMVIDWEFDDGLVESFRFIVAQSLEPWHAQRRAFRLGLVGWFGALAVATLGLLAFMLGRVMQPLGRIEREIREMETGGREALSPAWPEELQGVAANLNALLQRERDRQRRYRESLANLAHSLKTPLAAVRTLLPSEDATQFPASLDRLEQLRGELDRVDRIIGWQLRRAAASASGTSGIAPVAVAPIAADLADTLDKVYADRGLRCELEISGSLRFRGDEGDLQEILGNLMDNAWKYGRSEVRVSAALEGVGRFSLVVEDDGAGLDAERAREALSRGARLDETQPGQGIGLAVVNELVAGYGGEISVARSVLGGAAVKVTLPGG